MKISYAWLNELIDIQDISPEKISELLTSCGLEVESLEKYESIKGALEGVIIAEVISCEKHPNADKLKVCSVNAGYEKPLQIVCGAPNVAAGQKVLLATIGATLFPSEGDAFKIGKSKIRGVESEGMLCAEDELGLGKSHDGIKVLPNDWEVGSPASRYIPVYSDWIYEIGLTANRGDATGHLGVARDLRALLKRPLRVDFHSHQLNIGDSPIKVIIEDSDCIRYSGMVLSGLKVTESTPKIINRLQSMGLKPINNIVDASNYIMLETGQPMHAFDFSKLDGNQIKVRKASGEKLKTLDDIDRTFKGSECVICDANKPIAIAGVFGGKDSGVQSNTTKIFIESACFEAGSVRKTARSFTLSTDASYRFERGSDPEITLFALQKLVDLLSSEYGARIEGNAIDIYPNRVEPENVLFSLTRCAALIGKHIETHEIRSILKNLDITILSEAEDKWLLKVPAYKPDVRREADVIEEILRIYGLNQIEDSGYIKISTGSNNGNKFYAFREKVCQYLAHYGCQEIATNSLLSENLFDKNEQEKLVRLQNPLSNELNVMRLSMMPSMLGAMQYNMNRKMNDLVLFEAAKTYQLSSDKNSGVSGYYEEFRLAIALSGMQKPESWRQTSIKTDWFNLKSLIQSLLLQVRVPSVEFEAIDNIRFSEAFELKNGKNSIGIAGKLSPSVLKKSDVNQDVWYAELNLETLYSLAKANRFKRKDVAMFPSVRRDLALLLDEQCTFAQIESSVKKAKLAQIREVNLFDVYRGDKIPNGKKSYAISFMLQHDEKTMTDSEIESIMKTLSDRFEKELGASIRMA